MIWTWLGRPRPTWLLMTIGLAIGAIHAFTMLPLATVLGSGPFWEFPRGTVSGAQDDFADALVGYLQFRSDGWHWPLLLLPEIMPPRGTNLFWLDAVPWVSLLGKVTFMVTRVPVNLMGAFQFACFALPGAAMAAALAAFGQRGLIGTIAGAAIAAALPFQLAEWGHPALSAQFLILFALALYATSLRAEHPRRAALGWLALLALALLTNVYLFVMVGAIWAASLGQRAIEGGAWRRLGIESAGTVLAILLVMLVTGILSPQLQSTGAQGFGDFSLNLGSPLIPQNSGLIPPLSHYVIGASIQVNGYLGAGVLLLLAVSCATSAGVWRRACGRHAALIGVLLACFLFALSYRVTLGSHVLLTLPLPHRLVIALGIFRASGRFVWPVGYALTVLGILTVTRSVRPPVACGVLAAAALLQLVDVAPARSDIARTSRDADPGPFDRRQAVALVSGASAVMIFPSFGCIDQVDHARAVLWSREAMELQLIAARSSLPINSVYNPRLPTDCAAEAGARAAPLRPGVAYVYLDGNLPPAAQFGGADPAAGCHVLGQARACRLDATPPR